MKLPHNLKSIGQRVFSNCGRLCGTLELPASVTAIEFGAFMDVTISAMYWLREIRSQHWAITCLETGCRVS